MFSNLKKYNIFLIYKTILDITIFCIIITNIFGCADIFGGIKNDILRDIKTTISEDISGTKIGITHDNTPLIVIVGLYLLIAKIATIYQTKLLYKSRPDENSK